MNVLKFIFQLLIVAIVGIFFGAIMEWSRIHGLGVHFFVVMFFALFTAVNWKSVKDAQRANYGYMKLSFLEKIILFPMRKNFFRKENVVFQRTLLSSTICLLVLMTIIQMPLINMLVFVYIFFHSYRLKKLVDNFFGS